MSSILIFVPLVGVLSLIARDSVELEMSSHLVFRNGLSMKLARLVPLVKIGRITLAFVRQQNATFARTTTCPLIAKA
jgi:hypothetical protein